MKTFLCLEKSSVFFQGELKNDLVSARQEKVHSVGEVVFNTAHSGFQEVATDPSYFRQIVVMTAPQMGNYPVSLQARESKSIWISGFVCLQVRKTSRERSWVDFLDSQKVPILSDVDTRSLTLLIREHGTQLGAIVTAENAERALELSGKEWAGFRDHPSDWTQFVSLESPMWLEGYDFAPNRRVVLVDFGAKENIVRELKKRFREILIVPPKSSSKATIQEARPDLIFYSNGPGDPAHVLEGVELAREYLGKVPQAGICMGHQVLALASGAQTERLKFGHRGINHPVMDLRSGSVMITSQNHGYAVSESSLPEGVEVTHRHLNDSTVAGIRSDKYKFSSVQFHPESRPGPSDGRAIFDEFAELGRG